MKKAIKFLAAFLLCYTYCTISFAQISLNLDFECKEHFKYWKINDFGFTPSVDSLIKHGGKYSLKVESPNTPDKKTGLFSGMLPMATFAGKNVEFRGWIKTKGIKNGYAGLYFIIDGNYTDSLTSNIMADCGLKGDTEWTQVSVKMSIDKDAQSVLFGGIFKGDGIAWFDDFELYINGKKFKDIIEQEPKISLSQKEITALKKYIYPLRTYEPDGGDTKDLEVLDKLIGNSQVVALGEVSHGSSEIYKMKNRIIQYLAAHNGFNVFSMESNIQEASRINDYTINATGNPVQLIANMGYSEWNIEEVLDMVEWMRKFNGGNDKIKFMGFDIRSCNGAIGELITAFKENSNIGNKLSYLKNSLDRVVQERAQSVSTLNLMKKSKKSDITEEIDSILFFLRNSVEQSKFEVSQKELLYRSILTIEQYLKMKGAIDMTWRDKCMADNFMWIKETNPNSKFIIWAHNTHIAKNLFKDMSIPVYKVMGHYLAKELTSDYTNFGFSFFEGSFMAMGKNGYNSYKADTPLPGSLEYLLNQLNEPIFILDLKKIKYDSPKELKWLLKELDYRAIGSLKGDGYDEFIRQRKIANDFDYLIFIKKSSPSQTLKDYNSPTRIINSKDTTLVPNFNLDFEEIKNNLPAGWQANGTKNIKFSIDSTYATSGKYSASIECTEGVSQFGLFGLVIQKKYEGENITISGYIKTENVTEGHVSLLMRIDPQIGSNEVKINGTTPWTKYEVTVKMNPDKTTGFAIAAMLMGKGKVWFDDFKITINEKDLEQQDSL